MKRSGVFFVAVVLSSQAFSQPAKHPFGVDDMSSMSYAFPGAVSVKGDILYIVFHGGTSGPDSRETHAIRRDGSMDRKLDLPKGFRPYGFNKEGDLYGSFQINGAEQIATFGFDGIGSSSLPKSVLFLPMGFDNFKISPDGTHYALLADPRKPDADSKFKTVEAAPQLGLYVVGVDGSGGKWWAPDLHDISAIAWNPDGSSIAVLSVTPKIGFHYVKSSIDIATEGSVKHLATIDNICDGLAWSNQGKDIAFLSSKTTVVMPDHLWAVPAEGGEPQDRTPDLKGSISGLQADPNGEPWFSVTRGVKRECDTLQNGSLALYLDDADAPLACDIKGAPECLVFRHFDPEHGSNIAVQEGSSLKKITKVGDDLLAQVEFGPCRIVHWRSKEGIDLEGIVTFPTGFSEGRKYPFIVYPHGGPESNDYFGFNAAARLFAGLGYVVMQPQYRGSTGYGSDFMQAIYQHFGDRAYRDVDSATDFAIEQGWADPNRLAMFGWSAGGFMTSWTVTQTNRYKAAVEGAGISDWGSFIWTSDLQQIDYDARWPGKDPNAFHQFSPVDFADRVNTPLLILHGASDRRVPHYQGQELFEALLANGKTARMISYPGSGHFPSLWEQRRDIYLESAAWLRKYNP